MKTRYVSRRKLLFILELALFLFVIQLGSSPMSLYVPAAAAASVLALGAVIVLIAVCASGLARYRQTFTRGFGLLLILSGAASLTLSTADIGMATGILALGVSIVYLPFAAPKDQLVAS